MRSILKSAAMPRAARGAAVLSVLLLWLPDGAWGADPAPFQLVGPIEKFTLNPTGDPACTPASPALRAAHMTVHGIDVLLPCNLIIQFPATFLTAADAFQLNPAGSSESGLALWTHQAARGLRRGGDRQHRRCRGHADACRGTGEDQPAWAGRGRGLHHGD